MSKRQAPSHTLQSRRLHLPQTVKLIFRTGIHVSNLIDLPSTPPRHQIGPPTCANSSGHVHRLDPTAPCRRDLSSSTPPMNHRSSLFLPNPAFAPRTMPQEEERHRKRRHRLIREAPDLGFSPEQPEQQRDDGCKVDASNKVTVQQFHHGPLSSAREHGFHRMPRLPTLAARLDICQYVQISSPLASQLRCQRPKATNEGSGRVPRSTTQPIFAAL
jgi:hypothetical protein